MKTFFTLLLATIFTSSAFAYDQSRLTITVSTTNDVQLLIDNRSYRLDDNSLVINNIQSGRHTIQIYRNNGNNGRGWGNNKNKNRNEVLYSSTIYVKPNYDVDVMINRFGKAMIDERDLRYSHDDDWRNDNRPYGRNDNNGGYGNYPNDRNYNQAMSQYDFDQLVQKIRSQWFGNGKMNTAKDALTRNYFTTQQVRQVLDLFSSDNDKLELAKLAYRNTVDQRNYGQLYDAFASRSSRDELDQYIRNNRW